MGAPRILTIDIGTGTQDILLFEGETVIENSVQMIMPSPTVLVAQRVKQATADHAGLLLTGVTMGGGPGHWAVESHLKAGLPVYATPQAARTFDDDLERVAEMGVKIIDDGEAPAANSVQRIELKDFDLRAVMEALKAFNVPTQFDVVAVAVFDHGAAPPGYSDRRFRFDYLKEQVERGASLEKFGFLAVEIPPRMTRMQAVADSWDGSAPLFVMDTGPAAVLGMLDDPRVRRARHLIAANLGNFHTIAFLLEEGRIRGLFEHHTGELTRQELETYLRKLAAGTITNEEVFSDMGHGALELGASARRPDLLAVTGPRRGLLEGSSLDPYLAVPHGDMMIAGCFGLLRALAERLPEHRPALEKVLGPPARS